jgi:hypothetical protein
LVVFDAVSPIAYAAQEPEQVEKNTEENDQSADALHVEVAIDADSTTEEGELIERKVAEAVKRAMAQAEKLKQEKLDKVERKVEEKLAKVRLHHIELEKDARAKALTARKKATLELQAAGEDKHVKDRYRLQANEDGAVVLPADEAGKRAKARYRILLSDGEEGELTLQQDNDERIDQLTAMVKKLSAQVDRLSKELRDLRDGEERRGKDGEEDELRKKF